MNITDTTYNITNALQIFLTPSCKMEETIVVVGAPRSGTTWLAETLREIPGYKLLNEPLRPNVPPRAGKVGLESRSRIGPGEQHPQIEEYLRDVLRGKVGPKANWYFKSDFILGKGFEHMTRRRIVVKFCRAGRMIHWIAERFEVRRIVMIIRHPCAVIDSMMRYADWWRPTKNNKDARLSVEHIPNKVYEPNKCRLRSANTWVEKLAIDWCLNYWYAFFEDAKDEVYPWVLTTYEALVTKGEIEFKRIREALRIDEAEGPVRMLRRASSTVSRNADVSDSKQQISKWKRNLSNTQIDRILDIVDIFGMNFYDRSSEPLYDKVYQYQCSSHD